MPADPHLFEGEGERRRRYARLLIDPVRRTLEVFEHDRFFQDKKFDQLYGDLHREFAPLEEAELTNDFFQSLLVQSYCAMPIPPKLRFEPFEISVHMIRIEATPSSQLGRPAPEGIHRDGYHFGSIHLMRRKNLSGADNHVYDLKKKLLATFRLAEPMDSIYFDDAAIFHGVSPFESVDKTMRGTRDMLILLYQPLHESPQQTTSSRILRRL